MAFNGSGTFNRTNGVNSGSTTWQLDRDAAAKILASRHDSHDQDIADGLSNCITKDGQTTVTANLPMATYKHTGVGDAAARDQYLAAGQLADGEIVWMGTLGGSSGAFTASLTPTLTAYVTGMMLRGVANHAIDSSGPTLNVDSVGAKTIKNCDGTALDDGEIINGQVLEVVYDGNDFLLISPVTPTYQDFTPTWGASGGTYTSVTTNFARIRKDGKTAHIVWRATGTTGSAPDYLTMTIPFTVFNHSHDQYAAGHAVNVGTVETMHCFPVKNGASINLYTADQTAWDDGTVTTRGNVTVELA